MVLLAGLVLVLGPGRDSACLASDDDGTPVIQSPSAVEVGFVSAGLAEWDDSGAEKGSWYGYSVASAGDVDGNGNSDILVGAPQDTTLGVGGAAYLYLSSIGGELHSAYDWSATQGDQGSDFGWSVAGAGDVNGDTCDDIIIGAKDHKEWLLVNDALMEVPAGRAIVYAGVAGQEPSAEPTWSYTGTVKAGEFAFAVAGAGDLNKDGFDDIVVGARSYTDLEDVEDGEGAIYVFFGSPSGPSPEPDWLIDSDQQRAWLGAAVSGAGDVDGDGYDDLIVGAPKYVNPESELQEGAVFLFLGRPDVDGAPTSLEDADWRKYGEQDLSYFGTVVAGAGDVNGDGYADVVVSTKSYDRPWDGVQVGAAFAYCGSAAGLGNTPCWKVYGKQIGGLFGASAAGAGDVNGDTYDDVIVGAPGYEPDPTSGLEGAAFIYFGSHGGLMPWAGWQAAGDKARTEFGTSVASAGDVNGDDIDGIIIGAPKYFEETDPFGAAFCFYGPLEPSALEPAAFLPLVMRNAD